MELITWSNFNKKSNSTKQPSVDSGSRKDVRLKANTSLDNPIFLIDGVDLSINYCYLSAINRYYFITDIILGNNNVYELHCTSDLLATYKTAIGNYSTFIERSASNVNNMLIDNAVSSAQNVVSRSDAITTIAALGGGTGCYILRVVGDDGNGISTYCAASLSTFEPIFNRDNYLFDEDVELIEKLGLLLFNPFDYVVSLSWCPFSYQYMSNFGSQSFVRIKWFATGIAALRISSQFTTMGGTINVPTNTYSDFRAYTENFSKYNIYLPAVGCFDLSPQDAHGNLSFNYEVDLFTGDCFVRLYHGTTGSLNIIGTYSGNLYTQIPIGSDAMSVSQVAGSIVSSVGGFISGNVPLGAAGAIDAVTNIITGTPRTNGTAASGVSLRLLYQIVVTLNNFGSGEHATVVYGRPCAKTLQISTLTGFVKCGNASIDISGYSGDKDGVNSLLNTGFYYE